MDPDGALRRRFQSKEDAWRLLGYRFLRDRHGQALDVHAALWPLECHSFRFGTGRSRHFRHYRHPRTQATNRQNAAVCAEEGEPPCRARRRKLPTAWDDHCRQDGRNCNWKRFRKTRWR